MIILEKTGQNEALLRFDKAGAAQLILALSSIHDNASERASVVAQIDSGLLGARKRRTAPHTLHLEKQKAGQRDGSISRDSSDVVWRLVEAEEEISYAIERFSDAVKRGYFSPSEFLMIKAPKSTELMQIFGELIQ